MARAIVLLALLAVLVTCQSQNPGCGSIDLISIPLIGWNEYYYDVPKSVLLTPNGRLTSWTYDSDGAITFRPWTSSADEIGYDETWFNAQVLTAAQDFLAKNSTANRKIVLISAFDGLPEDELSNVIAVARRLKQSGVEIHVIVQNSGEYESFWRQVASPSNYYTDNCGGCGYYNWNFHDAIKGLTGMNSTGCAIMGANPRVSTFDGNDFTFNGLGDYWLVRASQTSHDGTQLGFQIRMSPCDNSDPSSGTCVRAASFRTNNGNLLVFYIDPATGLLTIIANGDVINRDVSYWGGGSDYVDGYYWYINPISLPGASTGYQVWIYYYQNGIYRQFGVVLGDKMGVNAFAVLDPLDLGSVVGLCGTFDGCIDNDFYSADQMYVNTGDSAANIYNGFSDTWRVALGDSYFSDYDFDLNTYYYANYPQYSKNWAPRMDSYEVTTETAEACKFFSDKSEYLYQACTDSVSMGIPEYAYVATGFLLNTCNNYCDGEFIDFAFVDEEFCQGTCQPYYYWDLHAEYNSTYFPEYSVNFQNTYGATAQFVLGGTYTITYASEYCDTEEANATVTITCDESPVVDAGADRTVSRTPYGWPNVYLTATASDVNVANLAYSWACIEAPLARNTTGYDGHLNPHGYDEADDVDMDWTNTPNPIVYPYYPGIYVFEVAVYDGCSITKDTVTINVTCDNCEFVVSALPERPYLETDDVSNYDSVSLQSSIWNYQFSSYSNLGREWVLESTSNNYKMVMSYSSNKVYELYEVTVDNVVNTTVTLSNNTYPPTDNTYGPDRVSDGEYLNRYEGQYELQVMTSQIDYITTTDTYLSSVDDEILTCTALISGYSNVGATFYLQTERGSLNDYPAPFCNGDYNFRIDYSDECFDGSETFTVTHDCVKSPVAQLVTCNPNLKFDYDNGDWPISYIMLDARDSYSESYPSGNLQYLYYALSQPTWDTSDAYLGGGNAITTVNWNLPNPMFTQTATWEFQVNVRDDCSFGTSEKATVTLSCDDQSPVLVSSAVTLHSSNTSATWNQFTLNATTSSNPHDSILGYSIELISGDQDTLSQTFPYSGAEVTLAALYGGSYSFLVRTYDGCWVKNSSIVTVNYVCDATLTPSFTVNPASKTAAYNAGWPTFDFDASGSTINTARTMTYTWYATSPSGDFEVFAANTQAPTFFTSDFQEVGTYTITFEMSDGCKTVQSNTTVTVTCPAINAPTIAYNGSLVANRTATTTVIFYTTPQTPVQWYIVDSDGNPVDNTFADNIALNVVNSGSYTAYFNYGNGCAATTVNRTITTTCQYNPTFPITTSTVTWSHNKFPKFTLAPTVTGAQEPNLPAYGNLPYTYTVLSAPVGSIWAPFNVTDVTSVTSNSTSQTQIDTNLWQRTFTQTVAVTTVTTVKRVNLVNGNEWFEGCFAADIPGDYKLQLSVTGYCYEDILSTVTVTAQCNTAPVANAAYTQEVATGYEYYIPIVVDGLGSTDADGDNLTYIWELVSVPANSNYMLNDSATQDDALYQRFMGRTLFAADVSGTYGLRLTVSDGCQNTTTDLSVVVSCNNNLAIANPEQSHAFDGFTPVSMSQFTFVATERCDIAQYWDVVAFTPAERVTPVNPPEPTSGASQVAMSFFALIALLALLL